MKKLLACKIYLQVYRTDDYVCSLCMYKIKFINESEHKTIFKRALTRGNNAYKFYMNINLQKLIP